MLPEVPRLAEPAIRVLDLRKQLKDTLAFTVSRLGWENEMYGKCLTCLIFFVKPELHKMIFHSWNLMLKVSTFFKVSRCFM